LYRSISKYTSNLVTFFFNPFTPQFTSHSTTMEIDSRFLSTGLLLVATILVAKLISAFIVPKSRKRVPPVVKGWPLVGGLVRFLKGPIFMLREEYPKLGGVFTLKLFHKNITFLIGPEVSAHFFKAPETDLSQQEVYQFNVPTFGPGVVFDVDYSVRQEQFRFFTEALRVNKLKSYVNQMVAEAEVCLFDPFLLLLFVSDLV